MASDGHQLVIDWQNPGPRPAASAPAPKAPKAEPAKQAKKPESKPNPAHKQGKSISRDNDGKRKE